MNAINAGNSPGVNPGGPPPSTGQSSRQVSDLKQNPSSAQGTGKPASSKKRENSGNEEHPQGVMQMLEEVNSLLGKNGQSLPGFGESEGINPPGVPTQFNTA